MGTTRTVSNGSTSVSSGARMTSGKKEGTTIAFSNSTGPMSPPPNKNSGKKTCCFSQWYNMKCRWGKAGSCLVLCRL
jgi:hypothetical protein